MRSMLPVVLLGFFAGVCGRSLAQTPKPPLQRDEPRDGLFADGSPLEIKIELGEEALAALRANDREYVRAAIHLGSETVRDAGVRLKGSAGSKRGLDDKPDLTLKFNQFIAGADFRGHRKLILNNSVQDPTHLCELLGGELFRAAGVPAPRLGHARVWLNGRDLGVYQIVEAITRDFLARWFSDPSGNLYEGPGDVTANELDVDSRGGTADRSDVRGLAEAASESDTKKRLDRLAALLDLDRFFSFLAMEAITAHWDGYAQAANNYHLYFDPSTRKFTFLPHGTDQLFQNPSAPLLIEQNGLVAKAVLHTAEGRKRYRARLKQLLDTVMNVAAIKTRVAQLSSRVRSVLAESRAGEVDGFDGAVQDLIRRVEERDRFLREAIAAPKGVKPSLVFDAKGAARPGPWQPHMREPAGEPLLERLEGAGKDGGGAYRVQLKGSGAASWRTEKLLLPAGRYRFSGLLRTEAIAVPETPVQDARTPGACLRISRGQPERKLTGTEEWGPSAFEFAIEPDLFPDDDGEPLGEVQLVCELDAQSGSVWFDEASLRLERISSAETPAPAAEEQR